MYLFETDYGTPFVWTTLEHSLGTPGWGGCGRDCGGGGRVGWRQLDPAQFGMTVKETLCKGVMTTQIFTNIATLKTILQI